MPPYNYIDGNPVLNNDPDGDCPLCLFLEALFYSNFAEAPETNTKTKADDAQSRRFLSKANTTIATAPLAGYKMVQAVKKAVELTPNYRYVGKKETEQIKKTGEIPNVKADGKTPKPVYFSRDKYQTGA